MDLSPHMLLTLTVLMAVAQLFTSLLLKLVRESRLSIKILSRSKCWLLRHRHCTHRSFDTSPNSALVFDHQPQDRSGLESPDGTLMEGLGWEALTCGQTVEHFMPATHEDDVVISLPTGFVSFIDSQGVLRTEKGYLDPMSGQVKAPPTESYDSLADVIKFPTRRAAE